MLDRKKRLCVWMSGVCGLLLTSHALGLVKMDDPAQLELISEQETLRPGRVTAIGLHFEIEPSWHLYWDGVNTTGFAPTIVELDLPPGYEAGPLQWPAPKRYEMPGGILDHIYTDELIVILPILTPRDAGAGEEVTIRANVEWLVCMEACLPGRAVVSISLPVGDAGLPPARSKDARLFDTMRKRLPRPLPKRDSPVLLRWDSNTLEVEAIGAKGVAFYPGRESPVPINIIRDCQKNGDTLRIPFEITPKSPARIRGILEITRSKRDAPLIYAIDIPRQANRETSQEPKGDS